jgi:hypothetical protein
MVPRPCNIHTDNEGQQKELLRSSAPSEPSPKGLSKVAYLNAGLLHSIKNPHKWRPKCGNCVRPLKELLKVESKPLQ